MKSFFRGVQKHLAKLDADHLREMYARVSEEVESLDKIFDAIDRGLVVLDESGRVVMSNPAARSLLGMEVDEALQTLAIPLGKSSKRELTVSYPETRQLELQTIPMRSDTLLYIRDVTAERARTEEELRAGATQAVRDLAAGVAHEIGNPLNAISLHVQMLERDPTDKEAISICKSQIKRLDGIIRGFLQALRPTRPNLRPGSLAEPLKDCLAALRTQLEERSIRLTLNVAAALPPVALDPEQMQQVFFNLVKNALEAMSDGGAIDVSLTADDHDVAVAFRDSGVGMDAESLAHLFEPYRTSKKNGTGLGLMISARIVHDHGGTIAAESKIGEGTLFTVKLPRLERRIRELSSQS